MSSEITVVQSDDALWSLSLFIRRWKAVTRKRWLRLLALKYLAPRLNVQCLLNRIEPKHKTMTSKMAAIEVLASPEWLIRPMYDPDSHPRLFKYYSILFWIFGSLMCILTAFYVAENSDDFMKVLQPCFIIIAYSMAFIKWICCVWNRQSIREVFEFLQTNVKDSKFVGCCSGG